MYNEVYLHVLESGKRDRIKLNIQFLWSVTNTRAPEYKIFPQVIYD